MPSEAYVFDAVRTPRGEDIMAACGQLKSDSVKQRASDRLADEAAARAAVALMVAEKEAGLTL